MARKIVITGGPGSGKSSIISSIESRGYHVEYEIGREVLNELRQKGYENPHKENRDAFQREVLRRQLEREERLSGIEETVFFDRGIVDNLAYYLLDSVEPPDFLERLARDVKYNYVLDINKTTWERGIPEHFLNIFRSKLLEMEIIK